MPHDEFVDADPMGLVGMVMPGEPGQLEAMAECVVEEYVRLGWDERRLMTLFANPMFLATHRIYRGKGEAYVRGLIRKTLTRWGGDSFRFPSPAFQPPTNCSLAEPGAAAGATETSLEI
jgi:hypothetical protein